MPCNELHRLIDIIAFGYDDYGWLHKAKDHPSQYLGRRHRKVWHYGDRDWLDKLTKLGDRPRDREARQSDIAHDMLDRRWSTLSGDERLGWAAAFKDVASHPDHYPNLFMPQDYEQVLASTSFLELQRTFAARSLAYLAGVSVKEKGISRSTEM